MEMTCAQCGEAITQSGEIWIQCRDDNTWTFCSYRCWEDFCWELDNE